MPKFNMEKPFVVHPAGNNSKYAQDLRRRQVDMLNMAENLFGPRDKSYSILGIEFVDDGPYIWYPCMPKFSGETQDKHIIIKLSSSAKQNMSRACFQMAHETVHLLAPTGGQNAKNLEEGVACYFSLYYMVKQLNEPNWYYDMKSYNRALALVKPRIEEDICCVRRLRERQPSFKAMTKEDIRKEFPKCTEEELCVLASKFVRN